MKQGTLLNEYNWQEVLSSLESFPFRASEIFQINKEINLTKVSFKYNIEGKETYYNGRKSLSLKGGEYLLAVNQSYCEVAINEREKADIGVCIDINTHYLQQAFDMLLNPNEISMSSSGDGYFFDQELFVKYSSNAHVHELMKTLYAMVKGKTMLRFKELECDFVKQFVHFHLPHVLSFQNIPAIKASTKLELYTKMVEAKAIIQDSLYQCISVEEIASKLFLSEFRFLHVFKQTFGVSPTNS